MARTVPAAVTRRPALRLPVSSRSDPVSRLAPTPMRIQSGFLTTASARDARASLLGSGIAFIISPLVLRNVCSTNLRAANLRIEQMRRRVRRWSAGAGAPAVRLIQVELAQGFALRGILGLAQGFSEF